MRVVANMSYSTDELPQEDGVLGTWIRPEDIETYEPYVEIVEFFGNRTQEQALFRIYAEEHKWPGELGLIIPDLNYLCVNRMVPTTLAQTRLNCGQRCQENGQC